MGGIRNTIALTGVLLLGACQAPDIVTSSLSNGVVMARATAANADVIPASTAIPSGALAAAPSGFTAFCNRDPEQCKAADNSVSAVALDASTWQKLWQVNQAWNQAVKPQEDAAHYGRVDFWTIPTDGYGDCEDYALAKRKSLADLGLPVQVLRLALARTSDGTAHIVLTVATDHGDYVLDNLNSAVLPWAATPYVWIARQAPTQTSWAFIGPAQPANQMLASAGITR